MTTSAEVLQTIAKLQGSGKTFAEFLAELFHDKFVEIYVGDSYEDISIEQVSITYPAVFCGKIIGAYREALVINSAHIGQSHSVQLGNIMFINERAIRALTEVNRHGTIEDMMLRSHETLDIKRQLG